MRDQIPELRSDEERLVALERIHRDARSPEGFDAQAVMLRAIEKHRQHRVVELEAEFLRNDYAIRHGSLDEPVRDQIAVVAPTLAVVLTCGLTLIAGQKGAFVNVAIGAVWLAVLVSILGVGVAFAVSFFIGERSRLQFLRHSAGAVVGGIALAIVLISSWSKQADLQSEQQVLAVELTEARVSQAALDGAVAQTQSPDVIRVAPLVEGVRVEQAAHAVRYRSNVEKVGGEVIAEVAPDGSGKVRWTHDGEKKVLAFIQVGTVRKAAPEELVLEHADGRMGTYRLGQAAESPAVGSVVGVIVDSSNDRVKSLRGISVAAANVDKGA